MCGGEPLWPLPFLASGPFCLETFVVLKTAGGAAVSPPSEKLEPRDALGRAAAHQPSSSGASQAAPGR